MGGLHNMAFIRQRGTRDCGTATLAMLCDVTYEEAERAISWLHEGYRGTTTKQLRVGAIKLGYTTHSTSQYRLKVVKLPRLQPEQFPPVMTDSWTAIPDNSLVKISHPEYPWYGWHWVAWRKGEIYDPAHGVFSPSKYGVKPSSYMTFKKKETT